MSEKKGCPMCGKSSPLEFCLKCHIKLGSSPESWHSCLKNKEEDKTKINTYMGKNHTNSSFNQVKNVKTSEQSLEGEDNTVSKKKKYDLNCSKCKYRRIIRANNIKDISLICPKCKNTMKLFELINGHKINLSQRKKTTKKKSKPKKSKKKKAKDSNQKKLF